MAESGWLCSVCPLYVVTSLALLIVQPTGLQAVESAENCTFAVRSTDTHDAVLTPNECKDMCTKSTDCVAFSHVHFGWAYDNPCVDEERQCVFQNNTACRKAKAYNGTHSPCPVETLCYIHSDYQSLSAIRSCANFQICHCAEKTAPLARVALRFRRSNTLNNLSIPATPAKLTPPAESSRSFTMTGPLIIAVVLAILGFLLFIVACFFLVSKKGLLHRNSKKRNKKEKGKEKAGSIDPTMMYRKKKDYFVIPPHQNPDFMVSEGSRTVLRSDDTAYGIPNYASLNHENDHSTERPGAARTPTPISGISPERGRGDQGSIQSIGPTTFSPFQSSTTAK